MYKCYYRPLASFGSDTAGRHRRIRPRRRVRFCRVVVRRKDRRRSIGWSSTARRALSKLTSRRCESLYVIRVRNATVASSAHCYCGLPSPRFGSVAGLFTSVAAPSISATVYRYYFCVFTTRNTANPYRFGGIKAVDGSTLGTKRSRLL